jgi:anti-sigma regulatory factor (Ser/Thr protein kinase)
MSAVVSHRDPTFLHEAFLYSSEDEFLDGMLAFIREGLATEEPTFVVLNGNKIERLRAALGEAADDILFADMFNVGANPARIIAAWEQFVETHGAGGQAIRGIGEPIWAGRSESELAECHRHESLLNIVFADTPLFRLVCPYDVSALDERVIAEAERNHPYVSENGSIRASGNYRGLDEIAAPFAAPLSEPPGGADELHFDADTLAEVRTFVFELAEAAGLERARADSLVLSVNEISTNSIRHGGGRGILRTWADAEFLICQVEDRGRIDKPLAGRRRPVLDQSGGRGLWLANQLCDLVQVRTFDDGNVVRIHIALG